VRFVLDAEEVRNGDGQDAKTMQASDWSFGYGRIIRNCG
jgi:hypothetical protein